MRFTAGRVYAGVATPLDGDARIVKDEHFLTAALRGGPHVESLVTCTVDPVGEERCRVTYSGTGHLLGSPALVSAGARTWRGERIGASWSVATISDRRSV
jgi:hypothetical protein